MEDSVNRKALLKVAMNGASLPQFLTHIRDLLQEEREDGTFGMLYNYGPLEPMIEIHWYKLDLVIRAINTVLEEI